MRIILGMLLSLATWAAVADPTKTLIGKSDYDVVSCAGAPDQVMNFSGGRQIMTFSASRSTGAFIPHGNTATIARNDHSCTAMVHLQNGRVTKIEFQKRGGFITREVMCGRVLKGCN